jgi:YVTN family beta-propeller protein
MKICGTPTVVDLVGNKGLSFGTVTVSNDNGHLTVQYQTDGDWELSTTHLAVAGSLAEIPSNPSGLPAVGLFPAQAEHETGKTSFSFSLSLDELGVHPGDGLFIAAHADVVDRNDPYDPEDDQMEGSWGDGTAFGNSQRRNTGSYFGFLIQGCTRVAQQVGPDGGTIEVEGESPEEHVTLTIPAGALDEPVEITVEAIPLSDVDPTGSGTFGSVQLIEGTTYDFGPDGLEFLQPVLLTIGYDDSELGPELESEISLFRVGEDLERIPGSMVDEVTNEVSAYIEHFTVYVGGQGGGSEAPFVESVGVTDQVTIVVRSPAQADVEEAIGVTDDVTITVRTPSKAEIAEAIGVTDDVTITVRTPPKAEIAEAIGVTDDVTITVRTPPKAEIAEIIGVTDDVTITVRSPVQVQVQEVIGVNDEVTITIRSPTPVDVSEPIGVTDNIRIQVSSPARSDVQEPIGVTDEVTITVQPAPPPAYAYVALQGADSVAVIDEVTNTMAGRISVGQFPFGVAVRPGGSEVYVTNRGDRSVSVIDVATQSVVASIPNVVNDPIDITFSPDGSTAYVVDNDASLIGVIDATTRTLGSALQGSTRLSRTIAVTSTGDRAYVAGTDSLVVFDLAAGTPIDTIAGTFGTGDLALTPDDSEIWLTSEADHEVLVFDAASTTLAGTVSGVASPQGIGIEGGGTTAWVAGGGLAITPIDVATQVAGALVGLAFEPDWIAVSADGSTAYVSEGRQGTRLAVVDLTTGSVLATLTVGSSPARVGSTR